MGSPSESWGAVIIWADIKLVASDICQKALPQSPARYRREERNLVPVGELDGFGILAADVHAVQEHDDSLGVVAAFG